MTTMAYILMTQQQRDDAEDLSSDIQLGSQQIDNPLANNLGHGTLVGKWVSPARLLNDSEYARWVPTLGTYSIHIFDSDTLFAPSIEEV